MNMFEPTSAKTPTEYIALLSEPRKSEVQKIHDFIRRVAPDLKPFIISGVLGYGKFPYKTKSGREGDWFTIGIASRKTGISVYVCSVEGDKYIPELYKDELKASVGRSCIRYKKFEDIDFDVLEKVVKKALKVGPGL